MHAYREITVIGPRTFTDAYLIRANGPRNRHNLDFR
jgi:hypothetical protein